MSRCPTCGTALICSTHGAPRDVRVVGDLVVPCQPRSDVSVRLNHPVEGATIELLGQRKPTNDRGIAAFEGVTEGDHTVTLTLSEDLRAKYKPPASVTQPARARRSEITVVNYVIHPRAFPLIVLEGDPVVVVKCGHKTLTLKADIPFSGAGTFTCSQGADKVKLSHNGADIMGGTRRFEHVGAGMTVDVEAVDSTALNGLVFRWNLEGEETPAATKTMTAARYWLEVQNKSGTPLTPEKKAGDGLIIPVQNKAKERRRAKIVTKHDPAEIQGQVDFEVVHPIVELFDAARDGTKLNLTDKFQLGPGRKTDFYVEGKTVSTTKGDVTLKLRFGTTVVDSCKVTVLGITLVSYENRAPGSRDDLKPVAEDKKLDPGRTLYLQSAKFNVQRTKLALIKRPHDTPCKLRLNPAAGADKIKAYPATGNIRSVDCSFENRVVGETALTLPLEILADGIRSAAGTYFWIEGAALSTAREVEVRVDAEEVDDRCDAVSFTVQKPALEIEVVRWDRGPLGGDIDVSLTPVGGTVAAATGSIPKATGKVSIPVNAGNYLVAVDPKGNADKGLRLKRVIPSSSDAAITVVAPASAKFELAAKYAKAQFIAYWVTAGAYVGTDEPSTAPGVTPAEKIHNAAKADIEGRCALMVDAITKAYDNEKVVNTHADTLKLFMAPEFYFRGKQGAYPFDLVADILNVPVLRNEITKEKYNDWLFVLGTAIGYIETDTTKKRVEHVGEVTGHAGAPQAKLFIAVEKGTAGAAVASGWSLQIQNVAGDWSATTNIAISGVQAKWDQGPHAIKELDLATNPVITAGKEIRLAHGISRFGVVAVEAKTFFFLVRLPGAVPVVGWAVEQGAARGAIVFVEDKGSNNFEIGVGLPRDANPIVAPITFVNPGETEIINIAIVYKGGSGIPLGSDGRSLKEVLVYKETISSVDFQSADYGGQFFYQSVRHLISVQGDHLRRARPTEGSTDRLGTSPNVPGTTTGAGTRITEVSSSGLGGGSVFTVDNITFGLEVCLDHVTGKLKKYYQTAPPGDPKVQIQLIPSCGARIANQACVDEGLVFNVDARHVAAEMEDGTDINEEYNEEIDPAPTDAHRYFVVTDTPKRGTLIVYEPKDIPPPEKT